MSDKAQETVHPPFTAFRFRVEFKVADLSDEICSAAFSECDGLEMTMAPKTIREGGNNAQPIHLMGPVSYGQLTLKRGMTSSFDLLDWFEQVQLRRSLRADGEVVVLASDGQTEQARFHLTRCLPVKVKAPALNAKDGLLAIEEMQLVYETLYLKRPGS